MRSSMFNRRRSPLSSYLKAPNATPHVKHNSNFWDPNCGMSVLNEDLEKLCQEIHHNSNSENYHQTE